jgi:hypothetical protein
MQNVSNSFIMSVCPSVHMELGSNWTDFYEIWHSCIFWKSAEKINISLKSDRIMGTSREDVCTVHSWQYLIQFFSEWETFHTKVADEIKTDISCPITFFWKSCHLWDNVEKYGTARHITDDNIIQCMLNNSGYRPTLRICNTIWFSMPTMITWMRLNVMFKHTLPSLSYGST